MYRSSGDPGTRMSMPYELVGRTSLSIWHRRTVPVRCPFRPPDGGICDTPSVQAVDAAGTSNVRRPRPVSPSRCCGSRRDRVAEFETGIGVSALRRSGYSGDRDAIYWRSSLLPARRLASLVAGMTVPSEALDAPALPNDERSSPSARAWTIPPLARLTTTVAAKILGRILFRTGWLVLVRERDADQGIPHNVSGFEPIEAPAGRFYADPFVVDTPDGHRLYVEDCPDRAHRGRISTLRRAGAGRWTLERVALDDLEHRAYPHVLRTEAGLLVTPDSGRRGGVDLFIDRGSSAGFERIGRCVEGISASDPTLLWHDGRYWLFVSVTGHGMSPWDELHVYSSASLTGLWHPHPRNPVVADARCARPAGRIFHRDGLLIRPGQDCSVEYGQRIVLSSITKLTTDEYEEHQIGSIEPVGIPGIQRTHTYSFDGSVEALDGYRRTPRWQSRARISR